jgi:DNA-binding MarR family transcriptional regulator
MLPDPKISSPSFSLPKFLERYDLDHDGRISEAESNLIQNLPNNEREELEERLAFSIASEILSTSKLVRLTMVPTEGISFDEFRILSVLHSKQLLAKRELAVEPGVNQKTLAAETNISPSLVSGLLDKMDESLTEEGHDSRQWISRVENRKNRKEKLITLTSQGVKSYLKARKDYKRQINKTFGAALTIQQLIELRASLVRINTTMDPSHNLNETDSEDIT